jgi:hypothetical protein
MRLSAMVKGYGGKRGRLNVAIVMLTALMSLPVSAQLSSVPEHRDESSPDGTDEAGLLASAAEMKLLGAPSSLDSFYLQSLGGPDENPVDPSQSLTQEPVTPTEALLAKGTATSSDLAPAMGASDSATGRRSSISNMATTSGPNLLMVDSTSQGLPGVPYSSPDGGAMVYRSPW